MRLAFLSIGRHIHTERWIRWFADQGHECHLLTVQPGPVDGVTVHDINAPPGPKPWRYLVSLLKVRRLLARIEPDLLNTHFLTGYGYWGRYSGFRPNVLTVWGDDVYVTPFENAVKNRLARAALARCDAVTGDSRDILEVAETLGADADASYRVLWGVDFGVFHPGDEPAWRRERGFADDDVLYFSPRSFTQPYYNIDTVIAAAARVQERQPRARFLFSGYEGDPAPFVERAEAAGIRDRAVLLGRLPHDEFAVALRACDVFISVPSVDATAVSLLEAQSSAAAVIISNLPSSCEWVADGVSGLIVPPRDVAALADAMIRLGEDPALRARLGAESLATARRHAGFAENMRHVDELFAHCLGRGEPPRSVSLTGLRRTESGT